MRILYFLIPLILIGQQPQPPSCSTLTVGGLPVCNTATVLTHALDVSNINHYCEDHSNTTAGVCQTGEPYAWGMTSGYSTGMWVDYIPSTNSNGGASLNVNSKGVMAIKLYDGITDPGARLISGVSYRLIVRPSGTQLTWRMSYGDSR